MRPTFRPVSGAPRPEKLMDEARPEGPRGSRCRCLCWPSSSPSSPPSCGGWPVGDADTLAREAV
jgi:hypothetical protein